MSFRTFNFSPFLILLILSNFYELFLANWLQIGSIIWFRIYGILEFFTILYYFYKIINKHRVFFKTIAILYLLLYTFLIVEFKIIDPLKAEAYLISFETILVFISSVLWFKQQFKESKVLTLTILPDFYYISGLILYFSGTFTLELLSYTIFKNIKSEFDVYWTLMIVFNIVLRIMILVGLWKKSKQ